MSSFGPYHTSSHSEDPGFISYSQVSAQTGHYSPELLSSAESSGKRRKMSKIKVSPVLKRAASSPRISSLGDSDSGGLSPSALDKRRNKLGYQRISIACGHCRRRKIRCVLAETDEHGRCQNCIRLKKECVFYPVDSAGGVESRAQQKGGLGSKASSVMSNSPSERKPGGMGDGEREFGHFPPLASNAPPDLASMGSGSGLGISTGTTMTTPEFGYESGAGPRDGWHPGIFQQPESAHSEPSTAGSWRVQDSPRLSDFTNYSSSDGQPNGPYPGYHHPAGRPEYGMQPPMRSMSYGTIEPSISFPPSTTASLDFGRQGHGAHYESGHLPTNSSVMDPAITPVATHTMPQYGAYSPQWAYYQQSQNSHPPGIEYSRHDSVSMQWYHPSHTGPGIEDQSRQHHQHQQQQQQQQHQQWQQHQNHLMPPPGSRYSKGHPSPG